MLKASNALGLMFGKNSNLDTKDDPKPKSVKRLKGIRPDSGTSDEKKLNKMKGKEHAR